MSELTEGMGEVAYSTCGGFARIENVVYAMGETNCKITRFFDRLVVLVGPICNDKRCDATHQGLGYAFDRDDIPALRRMIDEIESEMDQPMPEPELSVFMNKGVKL